MTFEELKTTWQSLDRIKDVVGHSTQDGIDLWAAQIVIERLAQKLGVPAMGEQ